MPPTYYPNVTANDPNEISASVDRLQENLWVLQAQAGDGDAARELVNRYERRLLYYLLRFEASPERAADVLQDIWLTVFKGLEKLRSPEAFRVWLYQIAHDRVVTEIRQSTRRQKAQEVLGAGEAEMDETPPFKEKAEWVHLALGLLPPEHREVLTLRFLEDLSLEEIAEAVRCPLGTVKSRLHHAKQSMKVILEKQRHG